MKPRLEHRRGFVRRVRVETRADQLAVRRRLVISVTAGLVVHLLVAVIHGRDYLGSNLTNYAQISREFAYLFNQAERLARPLVASTFKYILKDVFFDFDFELFA